MSKNEGDEDRENYHAFEHFLSEDEKRIFDALANASTMKQAAHKLGILPQSLYNWKYDLLARRKKAIGWLKATAAQRHRSKLLAKVLTARVTISWEKEYDEIEKVEKMGMDADEE